MRRALATLAFAALVGIAAVSFGGLAGSGQPAAQPSQAVFLIPESDGYGVAECLAAGAACGQGVADAWCEAQGFARAASFHRAGAGEITGAVQAAAVAERGRAVAVTCAR